MLKDATVGFADIIRGLMGWRIWTMQIAFFVTPVMFQPQQLAKRSPVAIAYNPFASLLEVVREPLLGHAPSMWAVAVSIAMGLIGLAFVIPFAGRYAPRAVYWL